MKAVLKWLAWTLFTLLGLVVVAGSQFLFLAPWFTPRDQWRANSGWSY